MLGSYELFSYSSVIKVMLLFLNLFVHNFLRFHLHFEYNTCMCFCYLFVLLIHCGDHKASNMKTLFLMCKQVACTAFRKCHFRCILCSLMP